MTPHAPRFDSTLTLGTADETADLARLIAPFLGAGDVILLEGPIGAGKTHFARSLIQARLAEVGRTEDVPSPTFTLVQIYDVDNAEIWHADLYRLTQAGEVVELGLAEAFETAICLVEWPERLGDLLPANALTVTLSYLADEGRRRVCLSAQDARWARVFAAVSGSDHSHE
jgi:tRNA threonylcarbamoyladenosine biosynthesis protein TsaE